VTEHAKVIRGLTQGIKDLAANLGNAHVQRQELRYVGMIARELQEKIDNLLQMLPRERRVKRGMLNLGGKALKFLFGAALGEDLGPINDKIETLRSRAGELVHDAARRVTVSREMDLRVRTNAKTLAQMVHAMKLREKEMDREKFALDQKINQTRDQLTNAARKASYTRELETLLMKVYADITGLALSLDLAKLHRLTAFDNLAQVVCNFARHTRAIRPGLHVNSGPELREYAFLLCVC
jgi:hypothetical protein